MPDAKISALPAAGVLSGAEPVPVVQSGNTVQTTAADIALTLANTAVTPATYGDATHVGQFTVDAKGRLTFAQDVAISGGGGMAIGGTVTSGTDKSVLFVDGSGNLAQSNPNFVWDDANTFLNIGDLGSVIGQLNVGNVINTNNLNVNNGFQSGGFVGATTYMEAPIFYVDAKIVDDTGEYSQPATGGTVNISDNVFTEIADPAGALLALTIVMPPTPENGQIVRIKISQSITALTISPNTGQSVLGAPTAYVAGQGIIDAQYRGANNTWYF